MSRQHNTSVRCGPTCFSLLAEVSHDDAKIRERRESLSFLSFLHCRERPLLAGKSACVCFCLFVVFFVYILFTFPLFIN